MALAFYVELDRDVTLQDSGSIHDDSSMDLVEAIEAMAQDNGLKSLDEMTAMEFDQDKNHNDEALWLTADEGLEWIDNLLTCLDNLGSHPVKLKDYLKEVKQLLQQARDQQANWRFRINL